jgi:UDP-N-acetylmuramoylalanine-D-glutamate ligase
MLLNRDDERVMAMLPPPVKVRLKPPQVRPHATFGAGEPQRPGDYGIETVNGMTWLVRAAEADETIKRRKDEEVELHVQRLMPIEALRIRGRHNATNALAALGLAVAAGCNLAPMLHGLREYRGEPHRVESVADHQRRRVLRRQQGHQRGRHRGGADGAGPGAQAGAHPGRRRQGAGFLAAGRSRCSAMSGPWC